MLDVLVPRPRTRSPRGARRGTPLAPKTPELELFPAPETRGYIERVISNFWLYRSRLGQPVRSLDESASGTWPVYKGVDGSPSS